MSYRSAARIAERVSDADHSGNESSECFLIADKPVDCRAKASLPTKYLQFGDVVGATNEFTVFAKKRIPQRTKFGPFEGVALYISQLDLNEQAAVRYFPLLMLDETHILDTLNENNSNWMRYVRLADSYAQQNLHMLLEGGQLYFRTTREIGAKEELRVGYHRTYAARFLLRQLLQPSFKEEHQNESHNVEECVESSVETSKNNKNLKSNAKIQHRRRSHLEVLTRRSPSKRAAAPAAFALVNTQISNFMTNDELPSIERVGRKYPKNHTEERSKKLLVKRCRVKKMLKFKCSLCAKSFATQSNLDHHQATHPTDVAKPYLCPHCQQQCATATALVSHIQSHNYSSSSGRCYACVYCDAKFYYVRDFKQHVDLHQAADGTFQCVHCKKHFKAYHLVRKHVRMSHTTHTIRCDRCFKRFQDISNLQRHQLTHTTKKLHACAECERSFRRRDQLKMHMRRKHSKAPSATDEQQGEACDSLHELKQSVLSDDRNGGIAKTNDELPLPPMQLEESKKDAPATHDGSQYLQLTPIKALSIKTSTTLTNTTNTSSSSSNRRKQIPTKLKAVEEINAETAAYVALSEMPTPFFISEGDLHEEFKKPDNDDIFCSPRKLLIDAYKGQITEKGFTAEHVINQNQKIIKNKIFENMNNHRQIKNSQIRVLENIKSNQNLPHQNGLHDQSKNRAFEILENLNNSRNWDVLNQRPHNQTKSNIPNENAIYDYIKPSHNLADYFWLDDQETNIENGNLSHYGRLLSVQSKNIENKICENAKPNQHLQQQSTIDLSTALHENINQEPSEEQQHNQQPSDRSQKNNENSNIEYIRPSHNLADYFWLDDQAQEEIIVGGGLENFKQLQPNLPSGQSKNNENAILENINQTLEPNHLNNNLKLQINNDANINSNNSSTIVYAAIQADNADPSVSRNSLYPLYPFSCHLCENVRFKRRGILVNHYAKLHPQQNLSEVALLNGPIVKPQLRFPCPHCRQCTYKSNNKRKAHILKHHPEAQKLVAGATATIVGSAEAEIYRCEHCPKQYAARSRLVAHYRKMHGGAELPHQTQAQKNCIRHQQEEYREIIVEYPQQEEEFNLEPAAIVYPPPAVSPENKLLKLSSAALELSRWDFLNERIGGSAGMGNTTATTTMSDDLNRLPALFDESPLADGLDATMALDKYKYGSIEAQFFEKIGKL